ncbi:MAG: UDP-N-acetylmuramate dehydrogenase [Lachnospiraceae bacterium]|nr:UDP-N-acetylmuramate dehydrogenase [Lachnospiraceae bacterium]
MVSEAVLRGIQGFVSEENIHVNEMMSAHTSFKVGGPADCVIEIDDEEKLAKLLNYLKKLELPAAIMGNGTNTLVSDKGYEGVIIIIGKKMNNVYGSGNTIEAQAGAPLVAVAKKAHELGLTGLEFAAGIPGTVGGGVVMNAGAYDGDMSKVVKSVRVLDENGEVMVLDNETMEFGYRTSTIKNRKFAVTSVTFELEKGDPAEIKAKMDDFNARRREKQPLEYPSAGSTFKRPEGYFAGKLIEDAGLKGVKVGGAQVSEKHSGFIINTGSATASDVASLIGKVQETVKERFGVSLEREVIFLGDFSEK